MNLRFAVSVLGLLLPFAGFAVDDGELWEATAQMNIPGMPAGMGGQKSSVCRAKNESPGPGRNDCKVTDSKRSGLTETMTVSCPDGTMNIEMTYNAARTEYKGKMTMKSKDGDMVMNMSGRKVGTCDVAQVRGEQNAKAAKMQAEGSRMSAEGARLEADAKKQLAAMEAQKKKSEQDQLRDCSTAVQTMDAGKLGVGGACYSNKSSPQCKMVLDNERALRPALLKACEARVPEFCKRFQTPDGMRVLWLRVMKEKRDEDRAARQKIPPKERGAVATQERGTVATMGNYGRYEESEEFTWLSNGASHAPEMCGTEFEPWRAANCKAAGQAGALDLLSVVCAQEGERLAPQLCSRALEKEYFPYLGQFCQAEGRPLARKECTGRDYTAMGGKYGEFCMLYMGHFSLEESAGKKAAKSGSVTTPAGQPAPAQKKDVKDTVTEGVTQGINKLKGLFGR